MNFVRHQFEVNYLSALNAKEYDMAVNMLLGELADWITTETHSFANMLTASGIKVTAITPNKITDAFLNNLRGHSLLQSMVIKRFVTQSRSNNAKLFSKKLIEGFNAIVGSHFNRTDRKDKDYFDVLRAKVKNYSKKIAAADGTAMEDSTEETTEKKPGAIVITTKDALKWITIGFAVYGAYKFIIWANAKITENARRSLTTQAASGGTVAPAGQSPIIIQQPAPQAVPAGPVQPAPITLP